MQHLQVQHCQILKNDDGHAYIGPQLFHWVKNIHLREQSVEKKEGKQPKSMASTHFYVRPKVFLSAKLFCDSDMTTSVT